MVFRYSYYANYDGCGTAVAAFGNTFTSRDNVLTAINER